MPYFVNEPDRSGKTINGHEDAISIRFEEQGFKRLDNSYFPKLTKKQIEENNITIDGMPLGSFIEQPAGSQSFPDFLVRDFDDRFFLIEAKSNKNRTCPMWNDNVPKQNAIYILSSGQLNKTTVFLGKDVITEDTYTLMEQQAKEIAKIVKKYNNLMNKADKHNLHYSKLLFPFHNGCLQLLLNRLIPNQK